MLHLLNAAINPTLPLRDAVQNWDRIAHALAERPRLRLKQLNSDIYADY